MGARSGRTASVPEARASVVRSLTSADALVTGLFGSPGRALTPECHAGAVCRNPTETPHPGRSPDRISALCDKGLCALDQPVRRRPVGARRSRFMSPGRRGLAHRAGTAWAGAPPLPTTDAMVTGVHDGPERRSPILPIKCLYARPTCCLTDQTGNGAAEWLPRSPHGARRSAHEDNRTAQVSAGSRRVRAVRYRRFPEVPHGGRGEPNESGPDNCLGSCETHTGVLA